MSSRKVAEKSLELTDKLLGVTQRDLDEHVPFYTLREVSRAKKARGLYANSVIPLLLTSAASAGAAVYSAIQMGGADSLIDGGINTLGMGACLCLIPYSFNLARGALKRADILSEKLEGYSLDEGTVEEINEVANVERKNE